MPVRLPWHTIFIGALTLVLVAIFIRSIDIGKAWEAILAAHAGWIGLATLVTLQTYLLRARRWQVLLEPIGRAGFRNAFRTTVIGYAANFLLPARIGEVLRPYLLARREGLDPAAAFATIIVERFLDLGMVLFLFAFALLTVGDSVGDDVKTAGALAAAVSVLGFGTLFVLAGHPERIARWAARLAGRLPPRMAGAISHVVQTFVEGLSIMRSPSHLARSLAWSLPLWLSIALGIFLTTRAFDLTMPFAGSFLVVGYLTVGVAAPTPGAVGGFHKMYQLALTQFFGADDSVAGAAAIVLHLLSFVPVALLGLVFMWQDGLSLGRLKGMRAEAAKAEAPEAL
jgi:uncharacterized protein (TIRG00374 family)